MPPKAKKKNKAKAKDREQPAPQAKKSVSAVDKTIRQLKKKMGALDTSAGCLVFASCTSLVSDFMVASSSSRPSTRSIGPASKTRASQLQDIRQQIAALEQAGDDNDNEDDEDDEDDEDEDDDENEDEDEEDGEEEEEEELSLFRSGRRKTAADDDDGTASKRTHGMQN